MHPEFIYSNYRIVGLSSVSPKEVCKYHNKNRIFLADSMPKRSEAFYSNDFWCKAVDSYRQEFGLKKALRFVIKDEDTVVGRINFDNIIFGPFRACYLGYTLDQDYQGQGVMYNSINPAIKYIFENWKMNRVMANYVPSNTRSGKLLKKLGFDREGYAVKYLKLNDEWRDHILTSKINACLL